jgi:tetratricopeptide (TPR) repeat protein
MLASAREDWADAEQRYRLAIPVWRAAGIEDQALYVEALLGNVLTRRGQTDAADSLLRAVITARVALNGAQHWTVGDAQEKLAFVRLLQRDLVAADSLLERGLAIRRAVYGPRSVQVAVQLPSLANVREERGDTASGIPLLRESLALLAELRRPAGDPTVLNTQRQLALALCSTGATREGEVMARAVVAQLGPAVPSVVQHRARAGLGQCLQRLGRPEDAEPLLLEAVRGLEQGAPPLGGLRVETVARWLEQVYEASGQVEQAAVWRARRK